MVFTGGWVPDDELARSAGIALGPDPVTSRPGVFAVGNLRLLGRRADQCVRDAEAAVEAVTGHLRS